MTRVILALLLLTSGVQRAQAQSEIFLVRHAEKADAAGENARDPDLSPTGRARAESLVRILRDANITHVYATEFKRTQQTAEPLARVAGVNVTVVGGSETGRLASRLREADENVLVVGHSNTLPDIVKALGIETPVAISNADYDNLFVVLRGAKPRLIHLHY